MGDVKVWHEWVTLKVTWRDDVICGHSPKRVPNFAVDFEQLCMSLCWSLCTLFWMSFCLYISNYTAWMYPYREPFGINKLSENKSIAKASHCISNCEMILCSVNIFTVHSHQDMTHSICTFNSPLFNFHCAFQIVLFALQCLQVVNTTMQLMGDEKEVNDDNGGRPLKVNYPINKFIERHLPLQAASFASLIDF